MVSLAVVWAIALAVRVSPVLSVTSTDTVADSLYPPPDALFVIVTDSWSESESATGVSVTVCGVLQFVVVKVSEVGLAVTAVVSELVTPIVTCPAGIAASLIV